MLLTEAVDSAFSQGGPLARDVPEYRVRSGQKTMALEIVRTLESGGLLVVEAGTGIGKTYAYLLPALLSGEKVLISTASKALQDQLSRSDIPRIIGSLGIHVRVAILKGRSSYLCLNRLAKARAEPVFDDPNQLKLLSSLESWALATKSGDISEFGGLDEHSPTIPLVTSTRDNCLGANCPDAANCHVNIARREAMAAELIVINHHLFFADLNIRESGVAELLPSVKCVIFDEAHKINEIGVQFLGRQLSSAQLLSFQSDVYKICTMLARGLADWDGLRLDLSRALQQWRDAAGAAATRIHWVKSAPREVNSLRWQDAINRVLLALNAIQGSLSLLSDSSPEIRTLQARGQRLVENFIHFQMPCAPDQVRWLDIDAHLTAYESPLSIGDTMREKVFPRALSDVYQKSWIFTSATLGSDEDLNWFKSSCGLTSVRTIKIESPFDYETQASLFVPCDFPAADAPGHAAAVADLAVHGALAIGGRTLVLTTTLKAMRAIGAQARQMFAQMHVAVQVLVQGEVSKHEILRTVNQSTVSGGYLIVACASFWEGIDIPGHALQLLVIDKLPFAPPDDPVQQARVRQSELEGKNAFLSLYLPQVAITLKQGAGRLIRRETDRGILVVCDTRLIRKGYGKKLLSALPPMKRLETLGQYQDALSALTKPSTTGLC